MYTAIICASLLIANRVDSLCQWNGDGDDGVTDWNAQCSSMSEDECGSHAFSRGHDAERCVWVDDAGASSASDSIEDLLVDDALPDPSEYGCIWDGTGGGDEDRMAMNCDRLTEAECRAAEDGNKDSRCRWRARVHLGWNMEEEQQEVKVVEEVSRWVDENPHQIQRDEHEEEHEEKVAEREEEMEMEQAAEGEGGETVESDPLGFDPPIPDQDEFENEEAETVSSVGWWEQPEQGTANEVPSDLPGYPESVPQGEQLDDTTNVDEADQDYSARFDHPKIELPEHEKVEYGSAVGAGVS